MSPSFHAPEPRLRTVRRALARAATATALLAALAGCGADSVPDLVRSARESVDKKDYATAIVQLKTALQKEPQSGEVRFLLGQTLLKRGDTGAAEVELGKARDAGYDDNLVLPLLARAMLANGKAKVVANLYGSVKLRDPKATAELQATVASAYVMMDGGSRAGQFIESALQLDPKNVQARYLRARRMVGDSPDEALVQMNAVIADAPDRADLVHFKGEVLWLGKGDSRAAVQAFEAALKIEPKYLPSYGALSTLALQRQDLAGFRKLVADLQAVLPQHPETRLYQAQVALLDKDVKKAREIVQQLLKVAPESMRVLELAGAIELGEGSLVLAETHLNKAVQLEPTRSRARPMLAETYLRLGQPDRTLKVLQPVLESAHPGTSTLALAAEAYLQAGDPGAAETLYRQAAKLSPQDPKLQTALALMRLAKGDSKSGFAEMEAAAKADKSTYADLALISARMLHQDFEAALADADRLVAKAPDKAMAHELRGRLLLQTGDAPAARTAFEKAASVDGAYFPAIAQLAKLDLESGRAAEATKRFEAVLAKDPRNFRARLGVIDIRERTGTPAAEISKALQEVVAAFPSEAGPRQALVRQLLSRGDTAGALTAAQEAASALPYDMEIVETLGRAQMAAREYQQALSSFGKIASTKPHLPEPHFLMAQVHLRRLDAAASSKSLKRALEVRPDYLPAQRALVELAMTGRQFDDAIAVARSIQKQRPKESVGFMLESDIHVVRRAWPQAIESAQAALSRRRASVVASKLVLLYRLSDRHAEAERFIAGWEKEFPKDAAFQSQLGTMALDRKDYADAEARFRRVLDLRKDDVTALNNLSWVLVRTDKPGAVPLARRANELSPGRASVMDTLALALAKDKAYDEALQWQRKAVELAPDIPTYRLNMARILVDKGDKTAARQELETLAKLGSGFSRQDEVRQLTARL